MIALVNMPFASLMMAPLAIGLLKARLNQAGLTCTVFNFLFAELIGIDQYHLITAMGCGNICEWLFAGQAWPQGKLMPDNDFLHASGIPLGISRDRLFEIRDRIVPDFIAAAAARVVETQQVRAVGFSCYDYQTLASFALIRRIKQIDPEIKIVCGGNDFHGAMGRQRMKTFEFIDTASLGEADDVIVPLFSALTQGRVPEGLQGIVYRDGQGRVQEGPAGPFPLRCSNAIRIIFPPKHCTRGSATRACAPEIHRKKLWYKGFARFSSVTSVSSCFRMRN